MIGGGIIRLSTVYNLAVALKEEAELSKPECRLQLPKVIVVESSDRLCPDASSQATGGLGDFGFEPNKIGVASISSLSYEMHLDMAEKYNGREVYRFSKQLVYRLTPKGFTGTSSPPDNWGSENPPAHVPLSALPPWVKTSDDWEAQRLSKWPKGAHLDPKLFYAFLVERVKELGVEFEMSSNVISVQLNHAKQRFIGPNRQIITRVDWSILTGDSVSYSPPRLSNSKDSFILGGLIINTGHSSHGITLGLSSGKVASELVLGKTPSVNILNLGLPDTAYL